MDRGQRPEERAVNAKGLGKGGCSELYSETKHNCTGKRTMGSLAGAGSEAAGQCATAVGRRSAAVSVNRTEHRSSGSLRPPDSVHYGRMDKFFRSEPSQLPRLATGRAAVTNEHSNVLLMPVSAAFSVAEEE